MQVHIVIAALTLPAQINNLVLEFAQHVLFDAGFLLTVWLLLFQRDFTSRVTEALPV